MKEIFEVYLMPILTFIGGGGAVYLINWRSIKKQAEAEAMKVVQDVYQQTIADIKADKEDMKRDNADMKIKVSELQKEVYQNTKDINALKSYKCVVMDCKLRKRE
jgi:ABC-type transporter MlaC component